MSLAADLSDAGHSDAHIEAFYDALRAAEPGDARAMIDNPTGWKP